MNNILSSNIGKIVISVILGLGLASLFRKVCKNQKCIVYRAPDPKNIVGNVYEWDDGCFKFKKVKTTCENKHPIRQK